MAISSLSSQYISASFQNLVQVSASGELFTGNGTQITNLILTSVTASLFGTVSNALTASYYGGTVISASYALTASYALNGGGVVNINTSSLATTGSNIFKANQTISGSVLISGSIIPNVDGVSTTSSFSLGSPTAAWKDIWVANGTINFINEAGTIQSSLSATSAGLVISGAVVTTNQSSLTGSLLGSASYALTASYALNGGGGGSTNPGGSNTQIQFNKSNTFAGTASFTFNYLSQSLQQGAGFAVGMYSHAQGDSTTTYAMYSHAEGETTQTNGFASHAEGTGTNSEGPYSHAEGGNTLTSGIGSHAEGHYAQAIGDYSHAEGNYSRSVGIFSHAEGEITAAGSHSHAEGHATNAVAAHSHAEGFQTIVGLVTNLIDSFTQSPTHPSSSSEINAPGEWTSFPSHNVFILADDFTYMAQDVIYSSSYDSGLSATTIFFTSLPVNSYVGYLVNSSYGDYGHAEGYQTRVTGIRAHAEGRNTGATGEGSHAEGYMTFATNESAHSEGVSTTASGIGAHSEGYGTAASGVSSHAEGSQTSAQGDYAHSEGSDCIAVGSYSHAEGDSTTSFGIFSHAEGHFTTAQGSHSHAEGSGSISFGIASHAQGIYTIASGSGQTVVGKYNKRGDSNSLFIIGNGTGDSNANRSDIVKVTNTEVQITGSLNVTQGITGSLLGTASNALTASYLLGSIESASYAPRSFSFRLQFTGTNPADATTYYFATLGLQPTVDTAHKYSIPLNSMLQAASVTTYTSTTATSEASSVYVRKNNTTDTLLSDAVIFGLSLSTTSSYVNGLNTTFNQGDQIQIKWVTPTWSTNPTSCGMFVDLHFVTT